MPHKRGWLTPDSLPPSYRRVLLYVPDDFDFFATLKGALVPLFSSENFEEYGTLTPEECARYWRIWDALNDWKEIMSVGTILYTAGNSKPDDTLWCDGSEVSQADFPALYDVLDDTWGAAASGSFRLPDLRDRFAVVASGNYALGDTGGENSHTLTTAEMPAHTHSVHAHETGVIGVELLPASTPALLPGETGSAGSGQAHENRPPYAALNAYIIAR